MRIHIKDKQTKKSKTSKKQNFRRYRKINCQRLLLCKSDKFESRPEFTNIEITLDVLNIRFRITKKYNIVSKQNKS